MTSSKKDKSASSKLRTSSSSFIYLFIFGCAEYLLLGRFSLVAMSRSSSLVGLQGLLISVASPVEKHRL